MLKALCVSDFTVIGQIFKSEVVRRRMAANHLGIILTPFGLNLHGRGYAPAGIRHHVQVAEDSPVAAACCPPVSAVALW
jgi:hypothetical protein